MLAKQIEEHVRIAYPWCNILWLRYYLSISFIHLPVPFIIEPQDMQRWLLLAATAPELQTQTYVLTLSK